MDASAEGFRTSTRTREARVGTADRDQQQPEQKPAIDPLALGNRDRIKIDTPDGRETVTVESIAPSRSKEGDYTFTARNDAGRLRGGFLMDKNPTPAPDGDLSGDALKALVNQPRSDSGMPSASMRSSEAGGAAMSSPNVAPPLTQDRELGSQVSIDAPPSGVSTLRDTPPSMTDGTSTTFADFRVSDTEPSTGWPVMQWASISGE
jgi:hypothetical protein